LSRLDPRRFKKLHSEEQVYSILHEYMAKYGTVCLHSFTLGECRGSVVMSKPLRYTSPENPTFIRLSITVRVQIASMFMQELRRHYMTANYFEERSDPHYISGLVSTIPARQL
jgi:hypothetical protein